MDQIAFNELAGWVTEAGLIGRTESELMAGFCRRVIDAGVPLARALVILDTLHPIHEGSAFLWRADRPETTEVVEYGRTNEARRRKTGAAACFFISCNQARRCGGGAWSPVTRSIFSASGRPATKE